MERIKDTITNVMQGLATKKTASPQDNPEAWLKKALTKKDLQHIKVHYFRKGILSLYVDSSNRLYSLNLKKQVLLGKLNARSRPVKDIRFRLGEIE